MLWRVSTFLTQYLSIPLLEPISHNHVEVKDSPYSIFHFILFYNIFLWSCVMITGAVIHCKMCTVNGSILFKLQILFISLFD